MKTGKSSPKPLEYEKDDAIIAFFAFLWIRDLVVGLIASERFLCSFSLALSYINFLYRITSVFCIRYTLIYFCLLCFTVFEEICCYLWEQSVG